MSPRDVLDVSLEDPDLRLEVALVTDLMIAANHAEGRLDQPTIDRLLGLAPR